jgi:hypothetical protein
MATTNDHGQGCSCGCLPTLSNEEMKFVLGRGVGEETADARTEREAKLALLRRERVERP